MITNAEVLDFCGCCAGVEQETPVSVENRPALSALAYRVGTHGRFKASMLAALGQQAALGGLSTRADEDPTIALLDGWAVVLDVLSFYQERIANEGYLRTATERRSVLELARRIGYELRPGVAAGTFLAFTVEEPPVALPPDGPRIPTAALVPVGTAAQSIPGQDELPQTFETVEEVAVRVAWNAIAARQRLAVAPRFGTRSIYLEGVANNLDAGDALLLVGTEREDDATSDRWDFRRIKSLEIDRDRVLTFIQFEYPLGSLRPFTRPADDPDVFVFRKRAALFGHNAPDWNAMPDEVRDRYAVQDGGVNARALTYSDWPGLTISSISEDETGTVVFLDAAYPEIVPDSWVALARPGYVELYRVAEVTEDSRSRFTLSAKTTRLVLEGENLAERFDGYVRETVVFAVNEPLVLAAHPIEDPVPVTDPDRQALLSEGTNQVVLAAVAEGLVEGRLVAVTGLDAESGEARAEIVTLKAFDEVDGLTRLTFEEDLMHSYARASVRFNANVARATHGETIVDEVLGSGDGAAVFQSFTLSKTPLTYVSAATASGSASTLAVRVNDVLWEEVPTLYQTDPDARIYVTRLADGGTVTVLFGDGKNGARLPTGVENVRATYRAGLGLGGLVEERQISLLKTRPLGVKKVINPLAPTGAADPEVLDDARQNAPLTVLTLDRIVSVQDFEDFARAFSGVAKAQATLLWNGEQQLVHLTIAGEAGGDLPESSDTFRFLVAAIDAARHVDEQVVIGSYTPRTFDVAARVLVDAAYRAEAVLAAVDAALLEVFSFEARSFGQGVTAGEVLAVMQGVEGVVAVDLEGLGGRDPFVEEDAQRLVAAGARWSGSAIVPAELLTIRLDPNARILTEMTTP